MLTSEIFWADDINVLFDKNEITNFLPNIDMTFNEKLNAIVRFSIYLTFILIVLKKNYLYFYIMFLTMITTYFIHFMENQKKKENLEIEINSEKKKKYIKDINNLIKKKDSLKKCVKPTYDNPFMNYNILVDDTKREPACKSYDNEEIKEEIENDFNLNLYKNVGDIFNRNNSQREYYTMPVTQSYNNQKDFANWLYNTGPSCKDGNGEKCVKNNSGPLEIPSKML